MGWRFSRNRAQFLGMTSPNQANLSHRKTPLRIAFYNLELSGQDAWHVRSTLTLTLALRAEHYSNRCASGLLCSYGPPIGFGWLASGWIRTPISGLPQHSRISELTMASRVGDALSGTP